jgi:hypothetical protein
VCNVQKQTMINKSSSRLTANDSLGLPFQASPPSRTAQAATHPGPASTPAAAIAGFYIQLHHITIHATPIRSQQDAQITHAGYQHVVPGSADAASDPI